MFSPDLMIAVAAGTMVSASVLSFRPAKVMLSWNQISARRGSFTTVTLLSTASVMCALWGDEYLHIWNLIFLLMAASSALAFRHLRHQRPIWSRGRISGIARITALLATIVLCWLARQQPLVIAAMTIASGLIHARVIREEYQELSIILGDLQVRLATLEAASRGIEGREKITKDGDKQRKAG